MKYSTHYVADGKGYRLVPHQGLITVYPKDGGPPRQASFVQSFNEDELRSANIRYFFPDGCQSPQIEIDQKALLLEKTPKASQDSSSVLNRDGGNVERGEGNLNEPNYRSGRLRELGGDSGKEVPKTNLNGKSSGKTDGSDSGSGTKIDNPNLLEALAGKSTGDENPGLSGEKAKGGQTPAALISETATGGENAAIKSGGLNVDSSSIKKVIPIKTKDLDSSKGLQPSLSVEPLPSRGLNDAKTYLPTNAFNNGVTPFKQLDNGQKCSDTCCDDNRPQILLSRPTENSCCKAVSKIIIPVEMDVLGRIPMAELLEISSEVKNIEMLQKLLKLVEKYKL